MSGDPAKDPPGGPTEDPFANTRMSLGAHLGELRTRLIRGVVAVLFAFAACWAWQAPLIEFAKRPHFVAMDMLESDWVEEMESRLDADPARARTEYFLTEDPEDGRIRGFDRSLQLIGPGEGFMFRLKICLYLALIFGAPVLLWQMWGFIAAGLYEKEKRGVRLYFPISLAAFLVGTGFGYFVMVPYAIYFLNQGSFDIGWPTFSAANYLKFFASLCLALGIVFQLPLVMTFLARTGVVEPATLASMRGHFIVGAFVFSAVLTPPDPFTQAMMGIPLICLYEVGILSSRIAARKRAGRVSLEAGSV